MSEESKPKEWTVKELEAAARAHRVDLVIGPSEQAVRVTARPWGDGRPVDAFGASLDEACTNVFVKLGARRSA